MGFEKIIDYIRENLILKSRMGIEELKIRGKDKSVYRPKTPPIIKRPLKCPPLLNKKGKQKNDCKERLD